MIQYCRCVSVVVGSAALFSVQGCKPLAPQAPTNQERVLAHDIYNSDGTLIKPTFQTAAGTQLSLDKYSQAVRADGSKENVPDLFLPPWFRDAHEYCKQVQRQSSAASTEYATAGWLTAGLGAVMGGTFIGLATQSTPSNWNDAAWKGFTGGGVALSAAVTAFGVYWLTRSVSSDHAATAAVAGLEGTDANSDATWTKCLEARANWTKENSVATETAAKTIQGINATQTGTGSGTGNGSGTGTGSDAGTGTGAGAGTGSDAGPGTDAGSGTGTGTGTKKTP